jgi:hypothetical protein
MIKSRTISWAGHIVRMGTVQEKYIQNLVGRSEGGDRLEDLCIDGRIVSFLNKKLVIIHLSTLIIMDRREIILRKRTGFNWLRIMDQWRVLVNTVMNFHVP